MKGGILQRVKLFTSRPYTALQYSYILTFDIMLSFPVYRGLLSQSKDGVDSYVSLMLLPDKSKATKKKTAVKKRDLNPEYNER